MMANKVPSSYVDIMLELDTITKEYSTLLTAANEANVSVLMYADGRNKLSKMKKQLEAMSSQIQGIDNYFNRVEANELLTCLLNAVRSSLRHPLHQA